MYKLTVQLDEKRINREGKYIVEEMWQKIDEIFDEFQAIKTIKDNGECEYFPNANSKNKDSDWACILRHLAHLDWLGVYGKKLLYFSANDDDISENCLSNMREKHSEKITIKEIMMANFKMLLMIIGACIATIASVAVGNSEPSNPASIIVYCIAGVTGVITIILIVLLCCLNIAAIRQNKKANTRQYFDEKKLT